MAGPGRTKPGDHKGHATGGILDQSKEGGETAHQPEHGIRPSARAVDGLPAVASRRPGEMGTNVKRAGSAGINKKHQVLVTQIRRGHKVSPGIVPHTPPSINAIPAGGLK